VSKHNHVFVRNVRSSDTENFIKLSQNTPENLFDPDVAAYPTSFVLAAYNKDKTVLFAPVQTPFMIDALAVDKENASELEVSQSLKAVVQSLVTLAQMKGVGEIYFTCKESTTQAFAERQCFEELPFKFYRLKIKDTEPHGE
jgi:hypothetical protein